LTLELFAARQNYRAMLYALVEPNP